MAAHRAQWRDGGRAPLLVGGVQSGDLFSAEGLAAFGEGEQEEQQRNIRVVLILQHKAGGGGIRSTVKCLSEIPETSWHCRHYIFRH